MSKIDDVKRRAEEIMKQIEPLTAEARAEGYSLEIYSAPDMSGKAQTRVAVLLK